MEDVKKWSVTYTKHVKQKRKVYQDGILHLLSNNKVMLYDECEQLLDSKFLTKAEAVGSGESLAFASFLVDISDPVKDCNPIFKTDVKSECGNKPHEKSRVSQGEKLRNSFANRKPQTTGTKASSNSLSPSQKIIRDFKRNEALKYGAHQSPTSPATPSFKDWEALYTTQITQKAKKYHDGYIRLIISGTQGRQIVLYDSSKNQLDKKFLKKDEIVSSGESLTFDAHLVDIGDPEGTNEDVADVKIQGRNTNTYEKSEILTGRHQKKLFSGNSDSGAERSKKATLKEHLGSGNSAQPRGDTCSSKSVDSRAESFRFDTIIQKRQSASHASLRDANQILSILRKPTIQDTISNVTSPVEQCLPRSSELVQVDDTQALNGSVQVDRCQVIRTVEKHTGESAANGGHNSLCSDNVDPHSKANHADLTAPPVDANCGNSNVDTPVSTQGIEKLESTASKSSQSIAGSCVDHGAVLQSYSVGPPSKANHADLTASPVNANCSNYVDRSVLTQGVENLESTASKSPHKSQSVAGSSVDHGADLESSKGFVDSHSSVSSKPTTHHQPSIKLPETNPESILTTAATLDMSKFKRFGNLGGLRTKKTVKAENSDVTSDCPSFDLGI